MAIAAVLAPRNVHTSLNYFGPTLNGEPPYNFTYNPPPDGLPQTNVILEVFNTVVHDIRGKENIASLDTTGFEFVRHVSEEENFTDEEAIRTRYYTEVEELIKKQTGAKKILIFDHTIRQAQLSPKNLDSLDVNSSSVCYDIRHPRNKEGQSNAPQQRNPVVYT